MRTIKEFEGDMGILSIEADKKVMVIERKISILVGTAKIPNLENPIREKVKMKIVTPFSLRKKTFRQRWTVHI